MIKYENIRKQIIDIGFKISKGNLTVGTWGNISARVEGKELMAITPSGVDYEKITPEGIVIMDFKGNIIDGNLEPSVEFPMHAIILKNRKDINALVHTHSDYVGAFAVARKSIPSCSEDMVQIVGGDVRVNEYKLPGTEELGVSVLKALEGRTAVVLANHGSLSAGRDLQEALKTATVIEKGAKQALFAQLLGGVVELNQEDINIMRKFYLNTYSMR